MTAKDQAVDSITKAHGVEIDTVHNCIANSVHLDGLRAQEITSSLLGDCAEDDALAENFGKRTDELVADEESHRRQFVGFLI